MAFAKEFMGCSAMEMGSSRLFNPGFNRSSFCHNNKRQFFVSPCVVPTEKKLRKSLTRPVAAISEDIIRKSFPIPSSSSSVSPSSEVQKKPSSFTVRAVLTVRNKIKEDLKEAFFKHIDALADKIGRNVALELVSTEIDPKTKSPKKSKVGVLKDWSKKASVKAERVNYTADFVVDSSFGVPGAITVTNKHQKEFFLEAITLEGFPCGPVHFPCNSWVQSTNDNPGYRIFFSNKPYLPNETPAGLRALREEELTCLRGDGKGVRKLSDRVYDYDVYNDLGNPDKGFEFSRPILGGPERPYPRRCRTGRVPTDTDMRCESRVEKPFPMYVPRDEQFEEPKRDAFSFGRLKAVLHNLIPSLKASISPENHEFSGFADIDSLYSEGLLLQLGVQDELLKKLPANVSAKILENPGILKYDTPKIISKDKFAWLRDDEFARQAIAGINPVSIERMEVFPPVSKLDPEVYGPQESALKEEHILGQINGMTVQQALAENKLFTVDYHDIYIPFLDKINAMDGRKAYATRTVYFLTAQGTLKPVAIELSLPRGGPSSRANKRVVTPPVDATTNWMWQLAKAHVCSNDAGVHQLVNHWLRTHACMEPFILSAHRQLSAMHPIYKLLEPHMRYTLEINGLARQTLISADGVIESCFTPGPFCMEVSAAAYKNSWRFDQEGLPADLIRRGIAVPDPTQPHGIKLLIDDYPYANDGLMIWAAIQDWVGTYVKHYYPTASHVCNDAELQAWYAESVKVGHSDVSEASWWPTLDCPDDVASILTTLIWLASAQHAALNFGQYPYGGYVPNRPPLMRRLLPQEGDPEHDSFVADPQRYFLSALPGVLQATKFMAVVDTLSTHSPDEEYLGERGQPDTWTGDADLVEAFYAFSAEVGRIEKEIDRRNADPSLKNRCGAGVLPYELLAPSSEPGVTCRGVPNSVSI